VRTAVEGDEYIGKTLAKKYRVEALIGEGGMGKVYKARQLALDKAVVL
jgi:serine/threonine-protein kinase